MTIENTTPEGQEGQNTEQTQERTYTEIELKAIDQGWIPKEEFDGDESEFIDAPEFVRRGELFKKIETQSKELKAVKQALDAFKLHHTKVKEAEYQRALRDLQDKRKQAMRENDGETAIVLEEQIDAIKAEKQQIMEAMREPAVEEYNPEFQAWVDNNQWYETDDIMRATADALGMKLHKEGHTPSEVLRMVEQRIKTEFSHKFKRTPRATAVEAPTRSGTKSDNFAMTPDERKIMQKFVSQGIMTEAEYIKELKRTR